MRFSHGHAKTHAGLSGGLASAWQARKPQTWGLVSGGREGSGQGLGRCAACPASGSPARLLSFGRPAGVGRGRAHAGQIVCKGWVGRGWPPGVPTPKFSGGLLPCAKVGFPITCLPENLSGEKFSGSPKFSAVCRLCVSAYILCKRVKEKMGVYMAYI